MAVELKIILSVKTKNFIVAIILRMRIPDLNGDSFDFLRILITSIIDTINLLFLDNKTWVINWATEV